MSDARTSGTRPQRDFKWLSEYLNGARSAHNDFIRQPKPGTDPLFFHYTDFNGLKAIATEHDLWLTHALYCNDEAEIRLGIEVAREQIRQLKNEPGAKGKKLKYLELLDKALSEPLREGVYICCFCEEGDDLSQWRAYGADGNGVSIQMDRNAFMKYTGVHRSGFLAIWNVFYPAEQQASIMRRALEETFKRFAKLPPDQIVRRARDVIDFFVPTFKHHGFKGEIEWRMIFVPSPNSPVNPRYRAKRDMLIPYYSLKDLVLNRKGLTAKNWRLPIREVRIGPNRHRELNRACAQSLLTDSGYQVDAVASDTPYRS